MYKERFCAGIGVRLEAMGMSGGVKGKDDAQLSLVIIYLDINIFHNKKCIGIMCEMSVNCNVESRSYFDRYDVMWI